LNAEQASLEAIRLINRLLFIVGSVQRPHQKTQSAQYKTPLENIPDKETGASVFTLETWDKLKKERRLGEYGINAPKLWRVRRELNPRPSD
jgi:hypothetical protein